MNTYAQIQELVLKSNHKCLQEFVTFVDNTTHKDIHILHKQFLDRNIVRPPSRCIYIFKRGVRAGQQCTVLARNQFLFCKKHIQYEDAQAKEDMKYLVDEDDTSDSEQSIHQSSDHEETKSTSDIDADTINDDDDDDNDDD